MLKQGQKLQQQQRQTLSPQQILSIRLLELSEIELEEQIKQELIDNPALEEGEDISSQEEGMDSMGEEGEEPLSKESTEELMMGDYSNDDDVPAYLDRELPDINAPREEIPIAGGTTFHDYLLEQLRLRNLPEEDRQIAEYIIGNIDDNGYLQRTLPAISDDLIFQTGIDVPVERLEKLLRIIQDFDPAGVGASTLQECLRLQLERMRENSSAQIAYDIVDKAFEPFSKRHYEKIQRQLNLSESELKTAIQEISQLNPKPGSSWNDLFTESLTHINPDFTVDENEGELILSLNNSNIPQLRISRNYNEMLSDYMGNKANQTREKRDALLFIKQKIDTAQSFINAIQQRQQTLISTMQAILNWQREFFLSGDESRLRPLILRDIAEQTGYDISTISRATSNKYVQTPFGIYPLKYFFSESMQNDAGEEISAREIKRILQEYIGNEDKHAPLTDDKLCDLLKEKGYAIARRTVAKYREQLGVPVARLRKII
ncbi:MAG: RNA polymerase factor sigma-54 [Porphyromonadaceae bacterium]|nr:RNA polymerase factor sigma-54 [Porphyromonadaceae bacterium]